MARHGRGRRVPFVVAVLALALAAPGSASAQRVEGRVVDQTRAAPIAAAAVTVLSEEGQPLLAVETDSSGFFSLPLTRSGTVRLQASALGYRTTAPTSVTVGPDERLEVEITLAVAALALEPLVITARGRDVSRAHRDFARRRARVRQTGFGRILEGEELETAFRLSTRLVTIGGLRRHRAPDGTLRLGDNR
ncbi:MAG: carboxypeptidase regulatory-like domain-containing protein, partial [Gemmatimonadetes bacterium]|nr:carboxypeptidase regulatory-like domain-containing protein [Gemmatimonadota bacterium]